MLEKSDLCRSQLSLRESPLIWTTTSSPLGGRPVKGQDVHMRTCHIDRCFSHFFFYFHIFFIRFYFHIWTVIAARCFSWRRVFLPIPFWSVSVTTPGDILNCVCLIKGNRWPQKANVQRIVHLFTLLVFWHRKEEYKILEDVDMSSLTPCTVL